MSKAAHNSCQARAEIPTGLGMHKKSTFAMSRLRHKQQLEDSPQHWHLFGHTHFPTETGFSHLLDGFEDKLVFSVGINCN